MAKIKRYFLEK